MASSVSTHSVSTVQNFKFRVKWDGKYVAGVSKVRASNAAPKWWSIAKAAIRAPATVTGGRSMKRSRWKEA